MTAVVDLVHVNEDGERANESGTFYLFFLKFLKSINHILYEVMLS